MNSLYNQLGNQQMNPMQMLNELRRNPSAVMKQAGYDIPEGMNNPNQIIQHLLTSGQLTQGRLQQAQQMARNFR